MDSTAPEAPKLAPGDRFLRLPEVEHLVGMKSSAIYQRVKSGDFPRPLRLAPRCSVFIESQVRQWMHDRVSASLRAA